MSTGAVPAHPLANDGKSCCPLGHAGPFQAWQGLGYHPLGASSKVQNCLKEVTSGSSLAAALLQDLSTCLCLCPSYPLENGFKAPLLQPLLSGHAGMRMWSSSFHLQELLAVITQINELPASTCCAFQSSGLFSCCSQRSSPNLL